MGRIEDEFGEDLMLVDLEVISEVRFLPPVRTLENLGELLELPHEGVRVDVSQLGRCVVLLVGVVIARAPDVAQIFIGEFKLQFNVTEVGPLEVVRDMVELSDIHVVVAGEFTEVRVPFRFEVRCNLIHHLQGVFGIGRGVKQLSVIITVFVIDVQDVVIFGGNDVQVVGSVRLLREQQLLSIETFEL